MNMKIQVVVWGLGLYISNNNIKIHQFNLEYEYIDGYHYFKDKD